MVLENQYFLVAISCGLLPLMVLLELFISHKKDIPFEKVYKQDTTNGLKGIFGLIIVLHHFMLGTVYNYENVFYIAYQCAGYLSVSVFMFISGYAFERTAGRKTITVKIVFQRIIRIYLPFVVATSVSALINRVSFSEWLWDICTLSSKIENGRYSAIWFVMAILYISLISLIICRFCSKDNIRILLMFIGIVAWTVFWIAMGVNSHWYNTMYCYLLGYIVSKYKDRFYAFFVRHFVVSLITDLFLLAGAFSLQLFTRWKWLEIICALSIAMLSFIVSLKVEFSSIHWKFIGKISYELYLIHGTIITLVYNINEFYSNLFVILALVLIVLSAWILNILDTKILSLLFHRKEAGKKC